MLLLIFVIAANLDNLLLSLLYTINKINLTQKSILIIATITTIGTFISVLLGKWFYSYLPLDTSSMISSVILIGIGCYLIIRFFNNNDDENINVNNNPSLLNLLLISFVLSVNNMGIGIGFSINDFRVIQLIFYNFVFSYLFLLLGIVLAKNIFLKKYRKIIVLISGFLIVILGLI